MYPLNMKLKNGVGFAVANDEDEHAALEAAGYGPGRQTGTSGAGPAPALATPDDIAASMRAQLDAAGISYPDNAPLAKLASLLSKA